MIKEKVFLNSNNSIDLSFEYKDENEVWQKFDLSSITKVEVNQINGSFSINSEDYPDIFDWDNGVTGKLIISFGEENDEVILSKGIYNCRVKLFDSVNTLGVIWETILQIEVIE